MAPIVRWCSTADRAGRPELQDGSSGGPLGRGLSWAYVRREEAVVEYAMQTPDGAWRVEVVKRGRTRWYRVLHGDNELDWLSIAAVQRVLAEAGIDMADLQEAGSPIATPVEDPEHGAA